MGCGSYAVGNYTGDLALDAPTQSWFHPTMKLQGHLYSAPILTGTEATSLKFPSSSHNYYSIIRMFYNVYSNPSGFVEVTKDYDSLFSDAIHPATDYKMNVYIYDDHDNLVFPFAEDNKKSYSYISHLSNSGSVIYNNITKEHEFIYSVKMDYSNYTIVSAIETSSFFTPIYHSLYGVLFVFIVLFAICLLCSHLLSKRLSAPLKFMYHALSDMDTNDHLAEIQMKESHIIEIDKLCNSFNKAFYAQNESTKSLLLLKEQELQSQMLALQSQMNPHFLYNSLMTIAAMAEEGNTKYVSQMCEDITSILRYISSNKDQISSLEEELEHCNLYLKCMKLRFGESLTYDYEIDDSMLDETVPKLCIQLLVENAVKFTANTLPPWHISIQSGYVDSTHWYIEVRDNGPGFDDETDHRLRMQMDEILSNGILPSLQIQGMGILNIFIRLYLMYGIPFIFDFGNLPDGGAFVKIGGNINEKD